MNFEQKERKFIMQTIGEINIAMQRNIKPYHITIPYPYKFCFPSNQEWDNLTSKYCIIF